MSRPIVVMSYSPKDVDEKEALLSHLHVLQEAGLLKVWSQDQISPGAIWEEETKQAISQAKIAILLISANYLSSSTILNKIVLWIREQADQKRLTIYPIIGKSCAWKELNWLAELNIRPKHGRPVWSANSNVHQELSLIAEEIAALVKGKVTHITPDRWRLVGRDTLLSDAKEVQQTIQEVDIALAEKEKTLKEGLQPGPILLKALLQNYQFYERQWPDTSSPVESEVDTDLKCFNQENIMYHIRFAPVSVRIVELSGPSGIGKTHVLRAVQAEEDRQRLAVNPERWGKWKYVQAEPHNNFELVMSDFIRQLGGRIEPGNDLVLRLARCIAGLRRAEGIDSVLFVVDSTDRMSDEVLFKLVGDQGPVGRQIREALDFARDIKLRLVVTARRPRFPQRLRTKYGLGGLLLPLPMDALDYESVRNMLVEYAIDYFDEDRISERPNLIDLKAKRIFGVSGGHPSAVNIILRKLRNLQFVLPLNEYDSNFRPIVLRIVQRDIIGDLSLKEYLLLNVLSIFRGFHIGLVRKLLKVGLLPADLMGDENPTDEVMWRWLGGFCEAPALIRHNTYDPTFPFTVHPVLRHVLPMDLENNSPQHLRELHLQAYKIYDQRLRERDPGGLRLRVAFMNRPIYTMEALYHFVEFRLAGDQQEAPLQEADREILDLAEEYRQLFIEARSSEQDSLAIDPFALRHQWEKDTELQDQIRQLMTGDEIYGSLQQLFERELD